MRRGLVAGLIAVVATAFLLTDFATPSKPVTPQDARLETLLQHAPTSEIRALEVSLRQVPVPILVPTKLPFTVTKVTESVSTHGNMSKLRVDFLGVSTQQDLHETLDFLSNGGEMLGASIFFTTDHPRTVKLRKGLTAYIEIGANVRALEWANHSGFYVLESDKDANHMLSLNELEEVANSME